MARRNLYVWVSVAALGLAGCSLVLGIDDLPPDVGGGQNGDAAGTDGQNPADGSGGDGSIPALTGSAGPDAGPQTLTQNQGTNVANGLQVFRFETFGNEGFWTKILQLPQGMQGQLTTPAQALDLGLSFDVDKIPAALKTTIMMELSALPSGGDPKTISSFANPSNTQALLEANAILGLVARNVTSLNGTIDINAANIFGGESIGVSCALCHSITDGSSFTLASGGSMGHRLDGPSNHNLQFGKLVSIGNHSTAFYPTLALNLTSNGHNSISRKGSGISLMGANPTEAEVDGYLTDDVLYPVGMFDDQPDGNGAPMHIAPLFRQDLAAPYGSEGSIHHLENFSNFVYTALLDPTDLLVATPATNDPTDAGAAASTYSSGQYLEYEKGGSLGLEILTNYKNMIEGPLGIGAYPTVADGYPYVGRPTGECATVGPAGVENEASIAGLRCNSAKLLDLNSYLFSLHPPGGAAGDPATIATGRNVFRNACTSCHNDDQSRFVPEDIVPLNDSVALYLNAPSRPPLYPDWAGSSRGARPGAPFAVLVPLEDSAGTFDDKLIVTEASNFSQPRGSALPLLMDLARKHSFLHDDEVTAATSALGLTTLVDNARGATAPHPYYVPDAVQRTALVAFLQSLDDNPLH